MVLHKKVIIGLATFIYFAAVGISFAVPVSVPSAPSAGYMLVATSTGAYIATTTDPAHFGSVFATSTTATSLFRGNVQIDGTCTGCTGTVTGANNMVLAANGSGSIIGTSTPSFSHLLATSTSATSLFSGNLTLTGTPTFSQLGTDMLTATNGSNVLVATSTPTAARYIATSTTATSTFAGGVSANLLNITSTSATSTFANGIEITGGCYRKQGSCLVEISSSLTGILEEVGGVVNTVTIGTGLDYTGTTLSLITPVTVSNGGTGQTTFTASQLLYGNGTAALSSVATSSKTCSSPLSCTAFDIVGSGGGAITISVAGDWTGTLDTLEAASFLRSDASDSYTSGTLTFDAGTALDLNTTTLTIADTGIGFDGASTDFAMTGNWTVNTDDLVVLKTSGNVGIGTTSPTTGKLVIQGTTASMLRVVNYETDSNPNIDITNDAASWYLQTVGARSDNFEVYDGNNVRLAIKRDGNVGIGTTSPTALLSIGASAVSSGGFYIDSNGRLGIGTSTPGTVFSLQSGSDHINLTPAATSTMTKNLKVGDVCITDGSKCLSSTGTGSGSGANTFLASTTASAATSTVTVSWTGQYHDIKCDALISGASAAVEASLRFHLDPGPNYGIRTVENGVTTDTTGQTIWYDLALISASEKAYGTINVVNQPGQIKRINSNMTIEQSTADNAPDSQLSHGVWDNSTTSLQQITMHARTETFSAGSRLTCQGANLQ